MLYLFCNWKNVQEIWNLYETAQIGWKEEEVWIDWYPTSYVEYFQIQIHFRGCRKQRIVAGIGRTRNSAKTTNKFKQYLIAEIIILTGQ